MRMHSGRRNGGLPFQGGLVIQAGDDSRGQRAMDGRLSLTAAAIGERAEISPAVSRRCAAQVRLAQGEPLRWANDDTRFWFQSTAVSAAVATEHDWAR